MIAAEIFSYDCVDAIHCVYEGGGDDWVVLPFRTEQCKEVYVLADDHLLAVGVRSLALFDAKQRVCVARRPFSTDLKLETAPDGKHIAVVGRIDKGTDGIIVYSGSDLAEILRIEDDAFHYLSPIYPRHDGSLIISGVNAARGDCAYVVTFQDGTAIATKLVGADIGWSAFEKRWLDPAGKRIAALDMGSIPVEKDRGRSTFGIVIDVWNLETQETEASVVVDRLVPELHSSYWGQDRSWHGDANYVAWKDYLSAIERAAQRIGASRGLGQQDGSLRQTEARLQSVAFDFLRDTVVDCAWEPSGDAFWVLLSAGILRRVGIDGSVSPRYVIERFATPPARCERRWEEFPPYARQRSICVSCLPDGRLEVRCSTPDRGPETAGSISFDPAQVAAERSSLTSFFPSKLFRSAGQYIVSRERDDFVAAPQFPGPPDDPDLEARRNETVRRMIEIDVPLASLSNTDCIAAIDWLTDAVATRFSEIVCLYWFRPIFILSQSPDGGTQETQRLPEEVFFAQVSEQDTAAADSLERLIDAFIPEARRVPPYMASQFYGPNEETPAMAHAAKALVTLDPTRYGVLRRYFTNTFVEHDAFVKDEVTRVFGKRNGWRDLEAIRLGLFWLFEQWSAGSGSYECLWREFGLGTEVQLRFAPEEFARLFVQEAEDYFATPDKDASINRPEWRPELAGNFFSDVRATLFGGSGDFNKRLLREMDRRLSCDAA